MAGPCGLLVGLLVGQVEELYYEVKIGYKPKVSEVLGQHVMRNRAVSSKLS